MRMYAELPDAELVLLLNKGNQDAYAEIYERYWGILYRYTRRILQSDDEAEDAVQDIFVMLWAKSDTLEVKISLSAFLYAATRNRILKHFEKSKVREKHLRSLQQFIDEGISQTDFLARSNELAMRIEQELAQLPPKMREVFELSRKANLSNKEIAQQLGIAETTVKKQISNAIKALKSKFGSLFSVVITMI